MRVLPRSFPQACVSFGYCVLLSMLRGGSEPELHDEFVDLMTAVTKSLKDSPLSAEVARLGSLCGSPRRHPLHL